MGSRQFVKETYLCYEEKPHYGKSKTLLITVEQGAKPPSFGYLQCKVRGEWVDENL